MTKVVMLDGLKTRYRDTGKGPAIVLLHGASLGSSLDVYDQNLSAIANGGFRTVACDLPGYGFTDNPEDYSENYRVSFLLRFMDALKLNTASVVAHSATARVAARAALDYRERVSKFVAVAAIPLLPPLPDQKDFEPAVDEPTLGNVRKRLEADLYDKSVITDEVIHKRFEMSVGKNFEAAVKRTEATRFTTGAKETVPLWKRLAESKVPVLYIFGRNDRGGLVEKRCALLRQFNPELNILLIDHCSHLVMIDVPLQFNQHILDFVRNP